MDIQLLDLWMPILIGSVACFLASSVLWMVLPHHKPDIKPSFDPIAVSLNMPPTRFLTRFSHKHRMFHHTLHQFHPRAIKRQGR